MPLSDLERLNALILAKTVAHRASVLDISHDMPMYLRRLHGYKIFSISEIAEIAGVTEYRVRQSLADEEEFTARGGIAPRHLDHLIRMVGSPKFAKLHVKGLIADGATPSAIARVSGLPESSIRRWGR